jgi:hypothetical protein
MFETLLLGFARNKYHGITNPGHTKGGSNTVLLTSCLTGLKSAV